MNFFNNVVFNNNGNNLSIDSEGEVEIIVDGKTIATVTAKNITFKGKANEVNGVQFNIIGDVSGDVDGTNITIQGDVGGGVDGTNVTVKGSVNGDIDGVNVTVHK